MKISTIVMLLVAALASPLSHAADMSAAQIMARNFLAAKVSALKADATMLLESRGGASRERRMTMLTRLQDNGVDANVLIRFLSPGDIRGTAFLQLEHSSADDDIWVYLPALKKSRRLVANNKKDSFFGSDFSYGDILPPRVDLYRHVLGDSETLDGHETYVIMSTPASDSVLRDSGYSRKRTWVRKDSFLEAKVEYYDTDGRLLKTQTATDQKLIDPDQGRWIAQRREMVNHQSGHRTVLTLSRIVNGPAVGATDFSVRAIERE